MTRPIRVLELLVSTIPGGGPRHVYDLVRHLPRDEFEVVIAAPRDGLVFDRFQALGLEVVERPIPQLNPWQLLTTVRLLRKLAIDVVHTHGKGAGFHGRMAAHQLGIPAIHTFHGIHYKSYPRWIQPLYLGLERRLSRRTDTIINVSAAQESEGLGLGLFRPEQSVVVVNGIDVDEFDRAGRESPVRREYLGLGADDLVIGCVSRFDPVKRLEVLLHVVHRLKDRLPRVMLVLVGGGAEEARIRRLAFQLGLNRHVIFTGYLEAPARLSPVLDLYVASSQKEGLPLSVLSAMGAGLAVVATDVPGHREVVMPEETGLLVPAEDPGALAEAVASLLADPARRRRMGDAGRRRVLKEFGLGTMVESTAAIYRRAARAQARLTPVTPAGAGGHGP
jgi:glycosyltransferase involved in cell wall biosynthesis